MNVIFGVILGLCGLLFIYLAFIRKWLFKAKLGTLILLILILPSLSSGIPFLYLGVKTIIKKETWYENQWGSSVTYHGSSAVAMGVLLTLIGFAGVTGWSYVLTN